MTSVVAFPLSSYAVGLRGFYHTFSRSSATMASSPVAGAPPAVRAALRLPYGCLGLEPVLYFNEGTQGRETTHQY